MDVIPEIASAMDLPEVKGALVIRVIPDSPADRAGLRGGEREIQVLGQPLTIGGDVIVRIEDYEVRRFDDILSYLSRRAEAGQEVELTIIRDGQTQTVTLILGERPSVTELR
jgi:S1-C subfamily serine protease